MSSSTSTMSLNSVLLPDSNTPLMALVDSIPMHIKSLVARKSHFESYCPKIMLATPLRSRLRTEVHNLHAPMRQRCPASPSPQPTRSMNASPIALMDLSASHAQTLPSFSPYSLPPSHDMILNLKLNSTSTVIETSCTPLLPLYIFLLLNYLLPQPRTWPAQAPALPSTVSLRPRPLRPDHLALHHLLGHSMLVLRRAIAFDARSRG